MRRGSAVIAPDKFKGSLTALEAAQAIARGIARVRPDLRPTVLPMADGGEGTVAAFLGSPGWRAIDVEVRGPLGRPALATFAFDGVTAICEQASASGLGLLEPGDRSGALHASSYGTGELVRAALDRGATRVVIGVGGSASNDGGAGALAALGARLFDRDGNDVDAGGAALARVARIDLEALDPRLRRVEVDLATDVDHPLLGERGASAVFGPQKGAAPSDVVALDAALERFADALCAAGGSDARREPGAGAGGGIPFAFRAVARARIAPGFAFVAQIRGLGAALDDATYSFTGEGSIDAGTLGGKVVDGVARLSHERGIASIAFGGVVEDTAARVLESRGCRAVALARADEPRDIAMREAAQRLERAAERVVRSLPN